MKGSDLLKIKLIGSTRNKHIIKEVVKTFDRPIDIEEISIKDSRKNNIECTPALIIEDVVINNWQDLTPMELKNIIYQFIEG